MSEIKGYTAEEVAESRKESILSDYNFCKGKWREIKNHEEQIEKIRRTYNKLIVEYRIASVQRVIDYIRQAKITDEKELDLLLCHCQNKLYGNIDGTELDLRKKVE